MSTPRQISLFELAREEQIDSSQVSLAMAETPLRAPLPSSSSLRVAVLGSGSRGNSLVLESHCGRLLVDAGFSCRELERRLVLLGIEAQSLGAVLLTHEHSDHCRGAVRFARRNRLPVYGTAGTLSSRPLGKLESGIPIRSGSALEVAGFRVEPFALPHDAREPLGFTIEDGDGFRVGVASDLGSRSQLAWAYLRDSSILVLEVNHDLEMLRAGPYPWALKQRVASRHGHLSNVDAARGLEDLINDRLSAVVLYHLSETNNLPALAHAAIAEVLERLGSSAQIVMTSQLEPSDWIEP